MDAWSASYVGGATEDAGAWKQKCKTGSKNPRARPVVVEGVEYGCIKDAALVTGINVNTLYNRLRRY